jgi:hypothetical protein
VARFNERAHSADPLVAQIRCPIFACYGSDDIGGQTELEVIRGHATRAPRVETAIFEGANHDYDSCEPAVAAVLAAWAHSLR